MKILLASDSHGEINILKNLVKMYPKMDLYLHCGDSELDPYTISPFFSCKGNCDYHEDFLKQIKINTPYGYLFMQHKNDFPLNVVYDESIKIFLSGHTHIPSIKKIGDKYFINPGSITRPRGGNNPSYIILTIEKDKIDAKIIYI